MASADDNSNRRCHAAAHFTGFLHAAAANLSSFLPPKGQYSPPPSSKIHLPLLLPDSLLSLTSPSDSASPSNTPSPSSVKSAPSYETGSGFPSTVRISTGKGGGPAFVGQVFSMCDLSGTGLMAVSTHFDIPFLSKRTPEWLKKMFAAVTKSERNGPVFRFFMDLGDAVSYVKKLNIPSGVVGACRLDIAYEHFKEKPDMFQFIPNERQVKEANKLLKVFPQVDGKKKVEGVPVFSAQNMDIAIATMDGIKWYTPYFFDKKMLDNFLQESVDEHFHALIETRNSQRRRDVIDDSLSAEAVEEMNESTWDPPEVQEVLDEMGHPGIPLSVISKAAEIQLLYAVDKRKSAAAFQRARNPSHLISNSESEEDAQLTKPNSPAETKDSARHKQQRLSFQFPFGDWSSNPWSKQQEDQQNPLGTRDAKIKSCSYLRSSPRLQWLESQRESRARCRRPT
ncbi:hypothetical protein AAHA92_13582 [Salvia divinorum]|uniref:Tic22-like family protein n=1 Tax=Salvia divinorum TaxID=28513 RepID=A0ABD1H8R5_SALDI